MPDNGGRRRGLVCPNNAKTHFHRFLRLATLSAYGVALCGYPKKDGYSFLARIFSFYYCSTLLFKMQAFCNVPLHRVFSIVPPFYGVTESYTKRVRYKQDKENCGFAEARTLTYVTRQNVKFDEVLRRI